MHRDYQRQPRGSSKLLCLTDCLSPSALGFILTKQKNRGIFRIRSCITESWSLLVSSQTQLLNHVSQEKDVIPMAKKGRTDHTKYPATLIKEYGDQAIRCCISAWNQLCPQHQLTNLSDMVHEKPPLLCGHEVTSLKEEGTRGEISKIMFEVSQHLTKKALRKNPDLPVIVLNCWTWWNYGTEQVHGWPNHIEVDVEKGCVIKFPEIVPPTPRLYCDPCP